MVRQLPINEVIAVALSKNPIEVLIQQRLFDHLSEIEIYLLIGIIIVLHEY
jgi:hypothetical protein